MKVRLISQTAFVPPDDVPWEPDGVGDWNADAGVYEYNGSQLIEFAGRACYQSWQRPNPKTATNEGYLKNILGVKHFSVLEHAAVGFYVTGVSRSLTHELVRHRHLSYSQLSQRYVDESNTEFVEPPLMSSNFHAINEFSSAMAEARQAYKGLVETLTREYPDLPRKEIRQAARAVLPNATETKIVVTGNYRAWWDVIQLRATVHADAEIRAFAIAVLRELQYIAPFIFDHFEITELPDGSEVAGLRA